MLRGALIFLGVFVLFLIITIGYVEFPPGLAIYDAVVGADEVDYLILGIEASTLIVAVFNGIIYGVIIWFVYWILGKAGIIRGKKAKVVEVQ